jgi:hypothetical protein
MDFPAEEYLLQQFFTEFYLPLKLGFFWINKKPPVNFRAAFKELTVAAILGNLENYSNSNVSA